MLSAKTIRRWLPLVLLLVLAVVAWQAGAGADTDEANTEPIVYDQRLASPLLTARRIPQTLQAPIALEALTPTIDDTLAKSTDDTCLLVSVDGRTLSQQKPEQPLVPASNQKLVTTYAALQTLGAEATFTTSVRASATPVGGVVDGDLYLVGGGDPFLATDDWWAQYDDLNGRSRSRLEELADQLAALGVTQVTGSLVGDESYFDSERYGIWAQRLIDSNQSGPLTALAVNEGFTRWPATYEGTSRPRVPSDNPPLQAAQVFAALLAERGVSVGSTGVGTAPGSAVELTSIQSPPLIDLITHVNSYSNNFGAELLVKHLGLSVNDSGQTSAGTAAINTFLRQKGFPLAGVTVIDGSGLAETNTVTCDLLSALLADAGPDSAFARSLSIGGQRGSLVDRHVGTPAEGRLLAKSGTLNGVTALSGFTFSSVEEGTSLQFAYVVNGELAGQDETIRGLQEPLVEALVLYPEAPAIGELQPLPTSSVVVTTEDEN